MIEQLLQSSYEEELPEMHMKPQFPPVQSSNTDDMEAYEEILLASHHMPLQI